MGIFMAQPTSKNPDEFDMPDLLFRGVDMLMRYLMLLSIVLMTVLNSVPVAAQSDRLKLQPSEKLKLDNGMVIILMEQHEVPLISCSFIVKAGSVADPVGKEGLAAITAGLLRKGTESRTANQISAELDFIGGKLSTNIGFDYTSGGAEFVKKDINRGLDILADVMLSPTFPRDEVAKLTKQSIDSVRSAKDEAPRVIERYFNAFLYRNHPYGRPVSGDEQSLASITRDDVSGFYQTYFTPSNTILAIVGDFNPTEMKKMLLGRFGAWPAKTPPTIKLPDPSPPQGARLLLVDKPDSSQTYYQIGNLGIARSSQDRVYIEVINTLFGGRFTSMLNDSLRVNSGLTYGAWSFFDQRKARGPFYISTSVSNENTDKALNLTLEMLRRLHENGVTEADLKSAKSYVKGQFPLQIETNDQLAELIAQFEFFGLDERDVNEYYAKINAMTVADAQRVIKQYFPLEGLVFVLIGKSSEIEGVARKYAPKIETKLISQPGFYQSAPKQ
jgi:zinc protease